MAFHIKVNLPNILISFTGAHSLSQQVPSVVFGFPAEGLPAQHYELN